MSETSKLLNREEVCKRLKIGDRTLTKKIASKELPPVPGLGGRQHWVEEDVEEYLQKKRAYTDYNNKNAASIQLEVLGWFEIRTTGKP
jgi:excisionase family DNA binding protein